MVLLLTCAHWWHIDYTPDAVPAEPEGLSRIPITPVTYFLWPSGQADACTVTNHAQRDLNSVTKTEYVTNENLWILNLWISTKNILTWTNNPICLTQARWGCLNQPSSTHTLQGNLSVEPKTTHWGKYFFCQWKREKRRAKSRRVELLLFVKKGRKTSPYNVLTAVFSDRWLLIWSLKTSHLIRHLRVSERVWSIKFRRFRAA